MNSIKSINPFWILVAAAFLVGVAVIFGLIAGMVIAGIWTVIFITQTIKLAVKGEIKNITQVIAYILVCAAPVGVGYLCYWLLGLILGR